MLCHRKNFYIIAPNIMLDHIVAATAACFFSAVFPFGRHLASLYTADDSVGHTLSQASLAACFLPILLAGYPFLSHFRCFLLQFCRSDIKIMLLFFFFKHCNSSWNKHDHWEKKKEQKRVYLFSPVSLHPRGAWRWYSSAAVSITVLFTVTWLFQKAFGK